MAELFVVLGFSGIIFGLVNLIRPLRRLYVSNRKQAGATMGASLVLMIAAGAALPPPEETRQAVSAEVTTTSAGTGTPTTPASTGTTLDDSTAVTRAPESATTTLLMGFIGPPTAGPSGDPAGSYPVGAETVEVESIVDGDTIVVVLDDGRRERLRLIGINSPESGECFFDQSTMALEGLIPVGSEAGLTSDQSDRDQFDRLLRYVWVGAMSVNEELVRRGAAIARRYPPDVIFANNLESAQADAARWGSGLWASDVCGPQSTAEIKITDIAYDAPGDDNNNLNGEWVTLRNDGRNVVDLTGWILKDESASHRYPFPAAFALSAGETVRVFTGCGDDFGSDLYWCNTGSAVWNNDGDTAFLLDQHGNIHHNQTYVPATTTSRPPTTTATTKSVATTTPNNNCDPSYPTVCIPPKPPDLDCGEISFRNFKVVGSDPHGFDGDNDGIGCES